MTPLLGWSASALLRNLQNLSQPFHLKSVKTCFFILSECPAFTAIHCYGNWTLRLRDTSPTGQFAYCLVISPTGHFAYWSFRLRDISPTGQFAYWTVRLLDISPTAWTVRLQILHIWFYFNQVVLLVKWRAICRRTVQVVGEMSRRRNDQ